jgi:hypothetical protein
VGKKKGRKVATPEQVAERAAYLALLAADEQATKQVVVALEDLWCDVSGLDWAPRSFVLRQLIARYDAAVVDEAIRITAPKVASGYLRGDDWRPYMWGVARRVAAERSELVEEPARKLLASALDEQGVTAKQGILDRDR